MFEQNSEIFKRFSSNNWIIIDSNSFVIPKKFKIESNKQWNKSNFTSLLNENGNWKEQRLKIAISPKINNYYIIDSEIFNYSVEKELLKMFSKNCSLYYFHIDLWNPTMSFEYYEKGECERNYKIYSQPNESGELNFIEESYGNLMESEKESLANFEIDDSNYNYFWFPLRYMNSEFNISSKDLNNAFTREAKLLKVDEMMQKKIEK